jgi:hypothetical protein
MKGERRLRRGKGTFGAGKAAKGRDSEETLAKISTCFILHFSLD